MKIQYADVVELVDSVDLGSSVFDVQVRVLSSAPKGLHKIDAPTENPDFIGVFAVFTVKKHKGRMTDENRLFCLNREI